MLHRCSYLSMHRRCSPNFSSMRTTPQHRGHHQAGGQFLMEGHRRNLHPSARPGHPQHGAAALQARCPLVESAV